MKRLPNIPDEFLPSKCLKGFVGFHHKNFLYIYTNEDSPKIGKVAIIFDIFQNKYFDSKAVYDIMFCLDRPL